MKTDSGSMTLYLPEKIANQKYRIEAFNYTILIKSENMNATCKLDTQINGSSEGGKITMRKNKIITIGVD